jgi:hypothetical protein
MPRRFRSLNLEQALQCGLVSKRPKQQRSTSGEAAASCGKQKTDTLASVDLGACRYLRLRA